MEVNTRPILDKDEKGLRQRLKKLIICLSEDLNMDLL